MYRQQTEMPVLCMIGKHPISVSIVSTTARYIFDFDNRKEDGVNVLLEKWLRVTIFEEARSTLVACGGIRASRMHAIQAIL